MLALFLLATIASVWPVAGQDEYNTRVHSSVIFTRSGERMPFIASGTPPQLTSLGAQQLYSVGSTFRYRYMGYGNSTSNPLSINLVVGLSNSSIDNDQLMIMTPNNAYLAASAEAFMQGLYPPFTLNTEEALKLDPTSVLANNTYMEYPLGGYQYAQVETFSQYDPGIIYLAGDADCIAQSESADTYVNTVEFAETSSASSDMYNRIGNAILNNILTPADWSYQYAYYIFEYLYYAMQHDTATSDLFNDNASYTGDFTRARQLANQEAWALYGNTTADGGIRAIAGMTLAAKVLGFFWASIATNSTEGKLNLMFGDYQPFLSFFALANMQSLDSDFTGIPDYGSSMVFELYSVGSPDNLTYPSEDEMWVKFYFRNGSSISIDLQAYPLFSRGPDETDMKWTDFEAEMSNIMLSSMFDWCSACRAVNLFCYANGSDTTTGTGGTGGSHGLSPQIAGVIGAVVTLAAIGFALLAAILLAGVRFHRVPRRRKSELGGFKGSAKLASDADLAVPKAAPIAGAVAGAVIDEDSKAKERIGSWELKDKEVGKQVPREEEDDITVNPFSDPVKPDWRV